MVLCILIAAFVISALIAGRHPIFDRYLAIMITLLLVFLSATFEKSFDRENYVNTIEWGRSLREENIFIQLQVAKDPMFLAVDYIAEWISDDYIWVFVIFAFLSLLPKLLFAEIFTGYSSLVISSYALFMAPTLEFAAIRAAAALGMLALFLRLTWGPSKFLFILLAVFAHISSVLPVTTILIRRILLKLTPPFIVIVSALTVLLVSKYMGNLSRSEDYLENQGTVLALSFPLSTMWILYVSIPYLWAKNRFDSDATLSNCYFAALICTAFSIGGCFIWVTIAYRILEFGWFFMAITLCLILKSTRSEVVVNRALFGLFGLGLLLAFKHVQLGTWSIML